MQNFMGSLYRFTLLVLHRFGQDQGGRTASALSYTSLLALVPFAAIAFAVLRAFPVFEVLQDQIKVFLFDNFLPQSVHGAQAYFDQFIGQTQNLTGVGTVALAFTAILLLSNIETTLNSIFRVSRKRPFASRLGMAVAVLTLGPLLLGASLSLGGYFLYLSEWVGADKVPGLSGFAAQMLPGALAVTAFALLYLLVPYRKVSLHHALIGGLAAGVLFGGVRMVFTWYILAFPAYQTIYGALSILPIFFIWMYLSWAIVILGGEIAANLHRWGQE